MQFTKYHGLGNDFIFVEDFGGNLVPNGESLAKLICHRQFGIGADGLVLVTGDASQYTMRIFNSDGSEAEMCGNAIRCMADYLLEHRLATGPVLTIGTISGPKEIRVAGDLYVVDMGEPDFSFNKGEMVELDFHGEMWTAYPVSMGNPHGVVFVEDMEELDYCTWGPRLEAHSTWPHKANIEFTQVLSSNHLSVRVWERGAGPTLACGTGACAAAVVASKLGLVDAGPVRVTLPGGDLLIEWAADNRVFMTGPATKVFTGVININNLESER